MILAGSVGVFMWCLLWGCGEAACVSRRRSEDMENNDDDADCVSSGSRHAARRSQETSKSQASRERAFRG
jgi:hypothetical protein